MHSEAIFGPSPRMRSADEREWVSIGELLEARGMRLAIADRLLALLRQPEAGYSASDEGERASDEAK